MLCSRFTLLPIFFQSMIRLSLAQNAGSGNCCPGYSERKQCNGHGNCHLGDCVCKCFDGFTSGDCSQRTCPYGKAWASDATATDTAHQSTECSNMGTCDRNEGKCVCRPGFTGIACDKKRCPADCSGHGQCWSMRYHALRRDPGLGQTLSTQNLIYAYEDVWDFDMVHGCECDSGYFGPDCSLRMCPVGDDPLTGQGNDVDYNTGGNPANAQHSEQQTVFCQATGGKFILSFRGEVSEYINSDDSSEIMSTKLNALSTIRSATVTYTGTTSTACTVAGNIITVTFTQDFGDLPSLVPDPELLTHWQGTNAVVLTVTELTKGTKENDFCSNRGLCDVLTGVCACNTDYDTSNGVAGQGDTLSNRGDCGFASATITACPGEVACSGHGVCSNGPKFRCYCSDGWQGSDCSEMSCPFGESWFDLPSSTGTAHALAECSDMGVCDRTKGECACSENFEGGACERMTCPTATGEPCSGHGQCLTQALLAKRTTENGEETAYTYGLDPNNRKTWDANKVQGCKCDLGYEGYDCNLRTCPYGDDPRTYYQHMEKQLVVCTVADRTAATGFYLEFRHAKSALIPANATRSEMKQILEAVSTFGIVSISFSQYSAAAPSTDHACTSSADTSNEIAVIFQTQLGNLPSMKATPASTQESVRVTADGTGNSVKGTRENIECSGRGICEKSTGICICFKGYTSSNGMLGKGKKGDCGFVLDTEGVSAEGA